MVEVGKDNVDSFALLAQEILDRNLDVVEGDVGGSSRGRVGRLDGLRLNAFTARDEEHREPVARVDSGREVVAEGPCGRVGALAEATTRTGTVVPLVIHFFVPLTM